jgi:hypothetical protein
MMWACGVERAAGKCARRAPRANHDDRPTPESAFGVTLDRRRNRIDPRTLDDDIEAENCDARTHHEKYNSLVGDR